MQTHDPDPKPARQDEPTLTETALRFIKEVSIFLIGLIFGILWYLFYHQEPDLLTHVIFFLILVIFVLSRYIYWYRSQTEIIIGLLVYESSCFLAGLLLGFYWTLLLQEHPDSKIHIIIGLVLIILFMLRYIYLIKREGPHKAEGLDR